RGTGQAVAGMRAGAAEEQPADRSFVARPIENGPHCEQLIECQFTVENMAASEAIGRFKVLWRDDLNALDEARKVRGVRRESLDDRVTKIPAEVIPIPCPQFVRRELNTGREHVLAVRSEGRIENGRDRHVEPRCY